MTKRYVSLEHVCDHVTLVRYHPSGKGIESRYSFAVAVVLDERGEWWFKGATGRYTRAVSKAIRYALSRAGFPRIRRLSGYGARERVITMERLKMKDLFWKAAVTWNGHPAADFTQKFYALPEEDIKVMMQKSDEVILDAKNQEEKSSKEYAIEFSGTYTDVDTGAVTNDPVVTAQLTAQKLVKHLREELKLAGFLIDWAEDDLQHGKKTGWDHTKAKKPKPKEDE